MARVPYWQNIIGRTNPESKTNTASFWGALNLALKYMGGTHYLCLIQLSPPLKSWEITAGRNAGSLLNESHHCHHEHRIIPRRHKNIFEGGGFCWFGFGFFFPFGLQVSQASPLTPTANSKFQQKNKVFLQMNVLHTPTWRSLKVKQIVEKKEWWCEIAQKERVNIRHFKFGRKSLHSGRLQNSYSCDNTTENRVLLSLSRQYLKAHNLL